MKQHEILILGAVGLGAFLLMRKASAAGTVRTTAGTGFGYPGNALNNARPIYIPATAQNGLNNQAAIDAQKYTALYGIGKLINGWMGTPSNGGQGSGTWTGTGYATGTNGAPLSTWPGTSSDGNAGEAAAQQYYVNNPDAFAVNPPMITNDMTNAAILQGMSEY